MNATQYPKPRVPVQPVLSSKTFARARPPSCPSVLEAGEIIATSSGTAAIALALRHAGIGPGDAVLVPAYHCRSMVEPVIHCAATPVYYRIREDTSVDLDDSRCKCNPSIRAMLVPHYFGIAQDLVAMRQFCDERQIVLIEDCAHAFFGTYGGRPLGSYGDYAVASVRKFFPVAEGGLLISSRRSLSALALDGTRARDVLKTGLDVLEEAVDYGRMQRLLAFPLWLKRQARGRIQPGGSDGTPDTVRKSAANFTYLDPRGISRRMSPVSRAIMHLADKGRIVRQRRENFGRMSAALSYLSKGRPLLRALPDECVPYMFPLIIDDPKGDFPRLKRLAVPIWRWEDADTADCTVSRAYAQRLLQLPCHQELSDAELEWMMERVAEVLK